MSLIQFFDITFAILTCVSVLPYVWFYITNREAYHHLMAMTREQAYKNYCNVTIRIGQILGVVVMFSIYAWMGLQYTPVVSAALVMFTIYLIYTAAVEHKLQEL